MCGSKQVQAGPIAESQPTRAEDIHGRVAVLLQVLEVFRVVDMGTTTAWHTIREASMISGLPESTLRYYEQIGIGARRGGAAAHRRKPEHHRTGEAPANRRQTINDNRQIFPTKE